MGMDALKLTIMLAVALETSDVMAQPFSERLFERSPGQLQVDLRESSGDYLRLRRWIIALAFAAMGVMMPIVLFQTGLIEHLPDVPGALFNSDKVNSSDQAYRFGVPDGTLVIASLAVTVVLAAFGSSDRAALQPWVAILLSIKAAVDAFFAGQYFWNMVTVQKVACLYCIAGGLLIVGIFFLSVPESWRATQTWIKGSV